MTKAEERYLIWENARRGIVATDGDVLILKYRTPQRRPIKKRIATPDTSMRG